MRKVHHLVQGSPEWKAHRATPGMINGSEIAAIMGLDPHLEPSGRRGYLGRRGPLKTTEWDLIFVKEVWPRSS